MLMSRALDPSEPVAAPEAAPSPRVEPPVAVNSAVAFFREPLAPIFTAMAVLVLVVAAIQFARTAGLVAGLWGAGGIAVDPPTTFALLACWPRESPPGSFWRATPTASPRCSPPPT